MKITLSELKQIIREEVKRARKVLKEAANITDKKGLSDANFEKFAKLSYEKLKLKDSDMIPVLAETLKKGNLEDKIIELFEAARKLNKEADQGAKKLKFKDLFDLNSDDYEIKIKSMPSDIRVIREGPEHPFVEVKFLTHFTNGLLKLAIRLGVQIQTDMDKSKYESKRIGLQYYLTLSDLSNDKIEFAKLSGDFDKVFV